MIGVSGVIFDRNGSVLLLKHRFWKKDSWGLPSGYIQKREKLEDAVKREVLEETGLSVRIGSLLNLNSGFKLRIECSYVGYCEDSSALSINNDEVLEAKFFPVNELPKGLLESHISIIQIAVQQQKN
jgi:ADP-ribose pyrophosphatase YjhB (NUDIX family)